MEDNQISRTALLTSLYRAYHSIHDSQKIFDDFMAYRFLKEEEYKSFETQMVETLKAFNHDFAASFRDDSEIMAFMMQSMAVTPLVLSRARYAEEQLEKMFYQGVKQYIILGAGMDSFAFRHSEMLEKIQVFELDHPATQNFKLRRLAELGWKAPDGLHFLPIDFTKESLQTVLMRSPDYNPNSLSFFSWLGVTYYLPCETVLDTLKSIAEVAASGSSIVFDYFDPAAFDLHEAAQRVQILLGLAKREEEPMKAGFDPIVLFRQLSELDLLLSENLSPSEIQARYFGCRKDKYYACEHAYFANVLVK